LLELSVKVNSLILEVVYLNYIINIIFKTLDMCVHTSGFSASKPQVQIFLSGENEDMCIHIARISRYGRTKLNEWTGCGNKPSWVFIPGAP